jgi:hypothetical protein
MSKQKLLQRLVAALATNEGAQPKRTEISHRRALHGGRGFVTDRGPVNGRQAIEKWYTDLYKGWHPKTTSPSSMGMLLT